MARFHAFAETTTGRGHTHDISWGDAWLPTIGRLDRELSQFSGFLASPCFSGSVARMLL
jgi:hypothetical protein